MHKKLGDYPKAVPGLKVGTREERLPSERFRGANDLDLLKGADELDNPGETTSRVEKRCGPFNLTERATRSGGLESEEGGCRCWFLQCGGRLWARRCERNGCGSNSSQSTCEDDVDEKESLEREAHLGWREGETW